MSELKIGLCLKNPKEAKRLTLLHREEARYPVYYTQLEELLIDLSSGKIDYPVIDVSFFQSSISKLLSFFGPGQQYWCGVFYSQSTRSLLPHTYGANILGFINENINLKVQTDNHLRMIVKLQLLRRLEANQQEALVPLQSRVDLLQKSMESLVDEKRSLQKETSFYTESLETIKLSLKQAFELLESSSSVEQFAILSLNSHLTSFDLTHISPSKTPMLPSLKTTSSTYQKESYYKMLESALKEYFQAEVCIFHSADYQCVFALSGQNVDRYQNIMSNITLSNKSSQDEQKISVYFDQLQANYSGEIKNEMDYFVIDFSNLINVINNQSSPTFRFNDFFDEFKEDIRQSFNKVKIYQDGLRSIYIGAEDEQDNSMLFQFLSIMVKNFEYWSYFNKDITLGAKDLPVVSIASKLPRYETNIAQGVAYHRPKAGNKTTELSGSRSTRHFL